MRYSLFPDRLRNRVTGLLEGPFYRLGGALGSGIVLVHEFSTPTPPADMPQRDRRLFHNGFFHRVENLAPGECRVYRVQRTA